MGFDLATVEPVIDKYQDTSALNNLRGSTDSRSLLLGVFFGLMVVMAIYNLLLYFSLKDKAYLLYVGIVIFNILTVQATNGLGEQYLWPESKGLDANVYVTFAGISMAFSSRFAAVFLQLKKHQKRLDQLMWLIMGLSLLMTVLSIFFSVDEILGFARWLVLLSFPAYLVTGWLIYRKGFKPAFFYLIAWVPYILGIVIRTMHGAGWLPTNFFTVTSIEIGGALEIVLLSFALADRIKGMRREIAEKELEKEQFKTKLLEEQKVVLEEKVKERTVELKEVNDTKDKFFSIIAHDLRSPMIGLQGVGQKLEYFIKKDKQEKLLEMGGQIDRSIDQLNHLLNNLLNWAASQMGGIPYHPEELDVQQLIKENIELYRTLAESKEVELIVHSDPITVFGDLNTLSTVIRNLLSNAIKFTKPGGEVMISIRAEEENVMLSVSDEGPGLDRDLIENIFNGDVKSMTGSKGEKGFGLGLKLCHEFVEMNGGSISANSQLGLGTEFIVTLPNISG